MTATRMIGHTCVGDLRLSALDLGFDLREVGIAVCLPADMTSVGLDIDGETWLLTGTRAELTRTIQDAGYRIARDGAKETSATARA